MTLENILPRCFWKQGASPLRDILHIHVLQHVNMQSTDC